MVENETLAVQAKRLNKKRFGWLRRKAVAIPLMVATVVGTYMGQEGGLPPFYTRKTGTSYGISMGLVTRIEKDARHYGPAFSLYFRNEGELHGAIISGANSNTGVINGTSIGFANASDGGKMNGLEVAVLLNSEQSEREPTEMNGLQLSLIYNSARAGKLAQVGLINAIDLGKDKKGNEINRWGVLINGGVYSSEDAK